jgi:hypothetical protein
MKALTFILVILTACAGFSAQLTKVPTGSRLNTSASLVFLNSNGWAGIHNGTPGSTEPLTPISVTRQGYTTAAATTTYTDTVYLTRRMRFPFPNQATLTPNLIALSEKLYSTDSITGTINQSTAVSPKPVMNWAMYDRTVVGNTITGEIVAGHYNGRSGSQLACVTVTATDGASAPVSVTVSTPTVSGQAGDDNAVIIYAYSLDITSLNNGPITVNANGYPWIGAAASVLDSSAQSARREFSPRYYLKDTTRSASPPYAYVTGAGNDGTGVWSTTAATAEATPFLTVQGAINAAAAQMPAGAYAALTGTGTARPLDGAIIRVGSGTFALGSGSATTRPQKLGALIITRDPNVARADSIVSFGTGAAWRPRLGVATLESVTTEGALIFRDISILRTNTLTIQGEAASQLDIIFDDVSYDNGSFNATIFSNSHGRTYGMTVTNAAASAFSSGTLEWRLFRGLDGNFLGNNIEGYFVIGSRPQNVGTLNRGSRTQSGSIVAFNFFSVRTNTVRLFQYGTDENVTGIAVMQNVCETVGTASNPANRMSGDNESGSITHLVHIHNTYTGFNDLGRANVLYNDNITGAAGMYRTHTYIRSAGNIHDQINTKHDVFTSNPSRTQSWEYVFGVGCVGELSQFSDAQGGTPTSASSFSQTYAGLLSSIGSSASVRNDPLFTDYQGTTSGPTVGAGNGTYTISNTSPAKNIVSVGLLNYDLAGTARSTPVLGNASTYGDSGAYVHIP